MNSLDLYGDIYRCECCSSFSDPDGVASFAAPSPQQTIPVSHFGNQTSSGIIKDVWTIRSPRRLSLGLQGQRKIATLNEKDLKKEKAIMQNTIDFWHDFSC